MLFNVKNILCICFALLFLSHGNLDAQVTFDWASVGDPGNTGEVLQGSLPPFGAVAYTYRISKHEVTNDQYRAFLNSVDATGTNPNNVYNSFMGCQGIWRDHLQCRGGQRIEVLIQNQHGQQTRQLRVVLWRNAVRELAGERSTG